MLKHLIENIVDYMQEHMGNINREMKTLRKNQKVTLEIKTIVTQMKIAVEELISKIDMEGEKISWLERMSTETSKTEILREKAQNSQ